MPSRMTGPGHDRQSRRAPLPGKWQRLLVQGDLFDISWEIYWWGSTYMDNVRHRNLQVERDVPVHGRIAPLSEVQQGIERQIKAAQDLCASVVSSGVNLRGCPVKTTVDR